MDVGRVDALTKGEGVTVAVLDSGVSDKHRVLKGKVTAGGDYTEDRKGAGCDLIGHGTVIAGVIAGRPDPEGQFRGMAPEAELLSIRVRPDAEKTPGDGFSDVLAKAIDEAVDAKVDIINLSVATAPSAKLEAAVERAHDKGVLLVAAAGNQNGDGGRNEPVYPAAYGDGDRTDVSVLAVANLDTSGQPAEQSNTGSYVDVAAPGVDIIGPSPNSETEYSKGDSGTSYATPFVTGTAALVMARFPDLSPAEVAERITKTAEHPAGEDGRNDAVGHGMVDPYRAVTADLEKNTPHAQAPPPRPAWPGDTEYFARNAAGVMLLAAVVLVVAVAAGRSLIPRIRRNRELADRS
ncbi:type VII secretion-associated serine protease mycosin [Stackebrandtia nassauensis]|uniref:Peptidase S8 and S53 subtilisin kexin sedolisin n=1 Tax=Stackebrandtia nassauensis (strain DSM 44728 / CIP 108903 / NRRL B-16338 / NBRC 102104 / LLR-40K-21) TaxID=446470 RepID=D3Q6Z6_STANL|nr:type VII secretion-associated serine protease mycosin [Stackebrandtia nassauensis]ADD40395.1 peptidase S8 and S53 subtilisin kexin sedolisin [Stackebrandtia nassauensis DSM 44728]